MVISRLAPTAVAASGLLAVAATVIWFGMLEPRRSAPEGKPVVGREAESRTPEPRRGQASPDATAPTADASRPEAPAPGPSNAVPAASPQPSSVAHEAPVAPSFDVVRVEPTGESVIAGRAPPGATVELLRNGKRHARVASDASGLFAFVPPPFPPGSHEVVLQSTAPDGTRTQSRESVTIVIAEKKNAKPLVALATPDRPTVILSEPEPPAATSQPRPGSPRPGLPEPQAQTAAAPDAAKVERPEPPAPASPSLSAVAPPSSPSTPAPQPGTASASAGAPAALPSAAAPP